MEPTVTLTRPLLIRVLAAVALAMILTWAVLVGDLSAFGVLIYPAVMALQTAREWLWRLEVSKRTLHERQGIGAPRTVEWSSVDRVLMPDSKWWRLNPVLEVSTGPNIQMTAGDDEDVAMVIAIARRKGKEVVGTPESITMLRSIALWVVLIAFAALLLLAQLLGLETVA
jgi:hypothetical protein